MKEALFNLPETLNETYERMLTRIEKRSRKDALVLLRWLAYAHSPPSLGELAEARVIDPEGDGSVDVDDRGGVEDTLDILSGLVTVEGVDDDDDETRDLGLDDSDSKKRHTDITHRIQQVDKDTRVKFAHFSVKEYLESEGILRSNAKMFYLESAREHRFLAQSCLTYLLHYSSSEEKESDQRDLTAFPLLQYAAQSWFYHSRLQSTDEVKHEINLLQSDVSRHNWCLVHQPDLSWYRPFTRNSKIGPGLYYACFLGLGEVVDGLLSAGADVNASGGEYGNALQAASISGHDNVAEILIERGADVNAQGGDCGDALLAASWAGHAPLVKVLLERGANVNACEGRYSTALRATSNEGNHLMAGTSLEMYPIDTHRSDHGSALQTASYMGHEKIVEMLIEHGANVNAQVGEYGNALHAASARGHEKIVNMLIDGGADINAWGGRYGNAMLAALHRGYEHVVKMLLDQGADFETQRGTYGRALHVASLHGRKKVVEMLMERGADVNARGGQFDTALQAASVGGHEKLVEMLIEKGSQINAQGGICFTWRL